MAAQSSTLAQVLTKVQSMEGKLNTFATLVNERETRDPIYRETFEAIYAEMEELKTFVKDADKAELQSGNPVV
jgi:hypothetical protein